MWNIKQMVINQQSKETYSPLLSNYIADFWTEYKNNAYDYDNYFKTLYKSFIFFDQEDDDTLDSVCSSFTNTIKNYLRANDKRLSELWRINVVADDESYNIAENYYRVDTYTKTASGQNTETNGQRTDTRTADGQSSDISGQRTDINDVTMGEQSIRNNDNVTGFNSNDTKRRTQNENSIGSRNDITQFTQGRQQNTASSHGSENFTQGSQQNSSTSQNSESYTLESHGAIGTMAVADLLTKNETYWANTLIFYEFVFREIAQKFLMVGN